MNWRRAAIAVAASVPVIALLGWGLTRDPREAAAFGGCAASFVVEGVGASTLGDRAQVERRLEERERFLQGDDAD